MKKNVAYPGMLRRVAAWMSFVLCLVLSPTLIAQTLDTPSKAVTVVIDDSGSMTTNHRWVHANYALKALAGFLDDSDTLVIHTLNAKKLGPYTGKGSIDKAIKDLNGFINTKEGGTPYHPVGNALQELMQRSKSEKWLIVITDGAFSGFDPDNNKDFREAVNAGVRSAFILIQQENSAVAEAWKSGAGSKIFEAPKVKDIEATIRKAAIWLSGLSSDNVDIKVTGKSLLIEPLFPLRRLILLQEDASASNLSQVLISGQAIKEDAYKNYMISPNLGHLNDKVKEDLVAKKALKEGLKDARIYHIRHPAGQILEPSKDAITLTFSKDVEKDKLLVLPDVAARFELMAADAQGKALQPDSSGMITVCDSSYRLIGRLLDDNNKSLLDGRTDPAKFEVKAEVVGTIPSPLVAKGAEFATEMKSGSPGEEVSVVASAAYAGYFHKTSSPIRLRFADCRREIAIKVIDMGGENGKWNSNVDRLENAKPIVLSVMLDGKPASAKEMQEWTFDFGSNSSSLESRFEDGKLLLRPRPFGCLWWWKEIKPGEWVAPVKVKTTRANDTINTPSDLTFSIGEPAGTWERIRWYGCPFATLASLAAALWYLVRLFRKSRFKPYAKFVTEEKSLTSDAIHPRTYVLREHTNAGMRWLWPSRAESVKFFGIRFTSSGDDVVVDGRNLTKEHKIPGWVFDSSRLAASHAKGIPQDDATMSDNMVMTIDMGDTVRTVRYRSQ